MQTPEEAVQETAISQQTEEEVVPCLQFIVTTKGVLASEKASKWLQENWDRIIHRGRYAPKITPFMSFAGKEGYMIGCMIEYYIRVPRETIDEVDTRYFKEALKHIGQ